MNYQAICLGAFPRDPVYEDAYNRMLEYEVKTEAFDRSVVWGTPRYSESGFVRVSPELLGTVNAYARNLHKVLFAKVDIKLVREVRKAMNRLSYHGIMAEWEALEERRKRDGKG